MKNTIFKVLGTEEKVNIQNNIVTSMEIVSVGIADE